MTMIMSWGWFISGVFPAKSNLFLPKFTRKSFTCCLDVHFELYSSLHEPGPSTPTTDEPGPSTPTTDEPGPSTSTTDEPGPSTPTTDGPGSSNHLSRKERLLKLAPVVPYGMDLKYWEEDKIEPPASIKLDSLHRFWKTNEHEDLFIPPQIEAELRSRSRTFGGTFEPVTRICGTLLTSGKFCQRMDRYKCPFHGEIVERDQFGKILDPTTAGKVWKQFLSFFVIYHSLLFRH